MTARTQAAATGLNRGATVTVTTCPANAGRVDAIVKASYAFKFITPVAAISSMLRFELRIVDDAHRHGSHAMRDLILRPASACLARRLAGLRDDGGRGAIGVLVAVLIGGGVLFGMGALVVDVGQIYQNRAELQNGADAAALAVAKSCAAGTCAPSIATQYATANASKLTGGKASVNLVCGVTGGGWGRACPVTARTSARRTRRPGELRRRADVHADCPTARTCCRPSSRERSPAPTRAAPCTPARRPNGAVPLTPTHDRGHDLGVHLGPGDRSGDLVRRAPPYPPNPSAVVDQVSTSRAAERRLRPPSTDGADRARQLRLDRRSAQQLHADQ